MGTQRSPELIAIQEMRAEMNTWGAAHAEISESLAAHSADLAIIREAVTRKPEGDDDSFGKLLRRLAENSEQAVIALARIEAAITKLATKVAS